MNHLSAPGAPAGLRRRRHRLVGSARLVAREVQVGLRARRGDRPLPDFLVIGAQRSGTTSLYQDLLAHPQVRAPLGKELQYFSLHHRRSLGWYRGNFPVLAEGEQTFEATPYYLFHPSVPHRVARALPHARLVAVLRDPVERAYSHYLHTRRTADEPLDFEAALAAEPERMRRAHELGIDTPQGHRLLRQYSYLGRGRYGEQLARWAAEVPLERIHLLRTEELHADPRGQLRSVLDFVGLPHHEPVTYAHHTRRPPGEPTRISDRLRADLEDQLADDTVQLLRLTGWTHAW